MSLKRKNLDNIKSKVLSILKSNKVTRAGIFGSYARGEDKENSDIDILVELNEDLSLLEVIRLKNLLEKTIKKKVDLVEYSLIRKELRDIILKEEIPILR